MHPKIFSCNFLLQGYWWNWDLDSAPSQYNWKCMVAWLGHGELMADKAGLDDMTIGNIASHYQSVCSDISWPSLCRPVWPHRGWPQNKVPFSGPLLHWSSVSGLTLLLLYVRFVTMIKGLTLARLGNRLLPAMTKILFLGHCSGNDVSGRKVGYVDRDICLCFAVQKGFIQGKKCPGSRVPDHNSCW